MVSERLTMERSPTGGPSSDDLLGASGNCRRDCRPRAEYIVEGRRCSPNCASSWPRSRWPQWQPRASTGLALARGLRPGRRLRRRPCTGPRRGSAASTDSAKAVRWRALSVADDMTLTARAARLARLARVATPTPNGSARLRSTASRTRTPRRQPVCQGRRLRPRRSDPGRDHAEDRSTRVLRAAGADRRCAATVHSEATRTGVAMQIIAQVGTMLRPFYIDLVTISCRSIRF